MLPQFYHNHLTEQLNTRQFLTLQLLVGLLQYSNFLSCQYGILWIAPIEKWSDLDQ
jgi:hypothetical protein